MRASARDKKYNVFFMLFYTSLVNSYLLSYAP